MTNITKTQKARMLLGDAITLVQAELESARRGEPAIDSIDTLEWVLSSLQSMANSIDTATRIEPPGLWHVATDDWPYKSTLRAKVIEAELAYEQLQ